ncbi:helix-turn-helix transcriptional regulator [Subtercola boreus]|uniref:WYL domain-containing protein n=1 Tax=Subtercola boreus TaxID=120213 RepID=A0A3E0WDP3_9MICO|nr:WYL domain-containing protein [Subtercola boreus]RFA21211.1 WYL domain-containing protein [Subtercola boreus]RFA21594.1 WYL domain-containing protein [Subtercola boreus]RFA27563.1 WYL domain-containing protein [Subtercola boreus]
MTDARAASPVPVEERLFSLVLALLATEAGLTKNEILSTVQGYRQRYAFGGDNASLERQFERDKDDIRELGVPLETVEPLDESGNNHNLRYRIPKGAYDLPADISFSPEEIALLNLAAMAWREGSLSRESRHALLKLQSLGVESIEPVLGYAPRIRTRDAAFDPLTDALGRRVLVRFAYLKPGDLSPRERTVAPLALVQHEGRWHVQGIDQDALAPRTFLLSRIVGPVTRTRTPFETDARGSAETALTQLDAIWAANTAVVRARAGSDAQTRLVNRRGSIRNADGDLTLHFTDLHLLADELAGFGPEVFVVSPSDLRVAVRRRLELTLATHGGTVR